MTDFSTLLQQGNAWLFIPSAILLGALHGLEPGHSKTMMAAFIIAVRGTLGQAILLGLAATLSHTAIVWAIALGGMYFSQQWSAETSEPYLQVGSAVLIIGTALWMMWRTWRQQKIAGLDQGHDHGHDEECLMLQGELFLDDVLLQEGDYQLAPAGTSHRITETDTGVVIYAHGDLDLRFVA